jgi:hypothetical protein
MCPLDTDAWINQLFEEFEKKTDKKQLELQVVGFIGYTAATLLTKYLWKHREEIRRCIKKRGAHLADLKKRLISDISYIQSDALEMEAEARSSLAPQRAYQFESYY